MTPGPIRQRWLALLGMLVLMGLLLACGEGANLVAVTTPRWACPSPTPLPTTIKESHALPTTTPGLPVATEVTYYQEWEREYGLPPRTPTPYGVQGLSFYLGQRVELTPVHVQADVVTGAVLDNQQLQIVTLQWSNATSVPVPIDYTRQVLVRTILQPNGAQLSANHWVSSPQALTASGLPALPTMMIPPGDSTVGVPILTPLGTAQVIEVDLRPQPGGIAGATPTSTSVGSPTPTGTPNAQLRAPGDQYLAVQWRAGQPTPPCANPGVLTEWGGGAQPLPNIPAPPGTARVVQVALQQVGKPYVWGAKGPDSFDCSGLTQWSYAQIGLHIPDGTAGQWPGLPPVTSDQLRSGDLLFWDTETGTRSEVTHVGLASDLNGNGQWDMVHAASPEYGIRVDYDVFQRAYYRAMYMGARTVR